MNESKAPVMHHSNHCAEDFCNSLIAAISQHRNPQLTITPKVRKERLVELKKNFAEKANEIDGYYKQGTIEDRKGITRQHFDHWKAWGKKADWNNLEDIKALYFHICHLTGRSAKPFADPKLPHKIYQPEAECQYYIFKSKQAMNDAINHPAVAMMLHNYHAQDKKFTPFEDLRKSQQTFTDKLLHYYTNPLLEETGGIKRSDFRKLLDKVRKQDWTNRRDVESIYRKICKVLGQKPEFNLNQKRDLKAKAKPRPETLAAEPRMRR